MLPTTPGRFAVLHRIRVECEHCGHSTSLFEAEEPGNTVRKELFRYIAEVKADGLDEVWGLTQNGSPHVQDPNGTWAKDKRVFLTTEGERVREFTSKSLRSTSIGDIVVEPSGTAWLATSFGWRRLTDEGNTYLVTEIEE